MTLTLTCSGWFPKTRYFPSHSLIPEMTARFARDYALLSSSDAHYLHEIGAVSTLLPLPA